MATVAFADKIRTIGKSYTKYHYRCPCGAIACHSKGGSDHFSHKVSVMESVAAWRETRLVPAQWGTTTSVTNCAGEFASSGRTGGVNSENGVLPVAPIVLSTDELESILRTA